MIDRVVTLGCKRRRRNLSMAYLFFLTTHQQWITPREGVLLDDLELLSFEAFGFLLLISSGQIDFYQLSGWSLSTFCPTCTFVFRSVNVCSFAFGIVSWNLVLAGCDSSRSPRKISYAFSPTASATSKSCCIFGGATLPVERHTRSCYTPLNGSSQWLWTIDTRDLTSVSFRTILVLWRLLWWKFDLS